MFRVFCLYLALKINSMEDRINEIDNRLKALENLHKAAFIILFASALTYVGYQIFKK